MTALLANRVESFASPEVGLAAEMALFEAVAAGRLQRGTLAWQTVPSLVAPFQETRKSGFAGAALRSRLRGHPVACRRTGGAVTPQGPGILNLAAAFVVPQGATATDAYLELCKAIERGLCEVGLHAAIGTCPGAFCDGAFNVLLDGRKVVGTAQRWRRGPKGAERAILVHALVLVDVGLDAAIEAVAAFEADLCGATAIRRGAHITLAQAGADADAVTRHLITELRHVGARAAGDGPRVARDGQTTVLRGSARNDGAGDAAPLTDQPQVIGGG